MTTFPTARAIRPANPLSVAARTLTDVMGSETFVPDLLTGLDLSGAERTWQRLPPLPAPTSSCG